MMTINRKVALAGLALAVGLVGLSGGASAAKKMTLQQAWKVCKAKVDKEYGVNTTDSNTKNRYMAGAACMKQHGYDL